MKYSFGLIVTICPFAMALNCPAFTQEAEIAKAIAETSAAISTKFAGEDFIFLGSGDRMRVEQYGNDLLNGHELGDDIEGLDAGGALKYALKRFFSCFEIEDVKQYAQLKGREKDDFIRNILDQLSEPRKNVLATVGTMFRSISAERDKNKVSIDKVLETLCLNLMKQDKETLVHWASNNLTWSRFLEDLLDYFHRDAMLEAVDWIKEEHVNTEGIFRLSGHKEVVRQGGEGLIMGKYISHDYNMKEATGAIKYALRKIFAGWITAKQAIEYFRLEDPKKKSQIMKKLFDRLSRTLRDEFTRVVEMADAIVANHQTNKMDFKNLDIVLGPNLIELPGPNEINLLRLYMEARPILLNDLFDYVRRKSPRYREQQGTRTI